MNTKLYRKNRFVLAAATILLAFFTFFAIPVYAVESIEENAITSEESVIDTSELTSSDWNDIREELSSLSPNVELSVESADSPFANIKGDENPQGNDSGWMVFTGFLLLSLGVVLLTLIIFLNVKTHKRGKTNISKK